MDEHWVLQDNLPEDVLQNKGETPIIFFHSFRTYRTHHANKDRKVFMYY
jgi:hypothetical protein